MAVLKTLSPECFRSVLEMVEHVLTNSNYTTRFDIFFAD